MNKNEQIAIPEEVVMSKIYEVRGKKVMIDRDLAKLYQVETKHLKRQASACHSRLRPAEAGKKTYLSLS